MTEQEIIEYMKYASEKHLERAKAIASVISGTPEEQQKIKESLQIIERTCQRTPRDSKEAMDFEDETHYAMQTIIDISDWIDNNHKLAQLSEGIEKQKTELDSRIKRALDMSAYTTPQWDRMVQERANNAKAEYQIACNMLQMACQMQHLHTRIISKMALNHTTEEYIIHTKAHMYAATDYSRDALKMAEKAKESAKKLEKSKN